MVADNRVAICTRSMNPYLYAKAMAFIALPHRRIRITDQSASGYLETIFYEIDADYVINIDEDAFVCDNDGVAGLLREIATNEYLGCGVPDGGVIPIRSHNPLVVNPFFNIFNTARVRELSKARTGDWPPVPGDLDLTAVRHLLRRPYSLVEFEPYERLLTWLAQTGSIKYLDAQVGGDGISTLPLLASGRPLLIHTWYSRYYGRDLYHTRRIQRAIDWAARSSKCGSSVTTTEAIRHCGGAALFTAKARLAASASKAMTSVLQNPLHWGE